MKFILLMSLYYLMNLKIVVTKLSTAKIKSIEQDESLMELADLRGLKLYKYNKTTLALSGNIIIFKEFVNIKLNFGVSKKLGNGYIPMSIIDLRNQDFCDLLNNSVMKIYLKDMFDHSNIPYGCHVMPGEYKFTNYVPVAPHNIPSGEYRSEVVFLQNEKPVLKYKCFVNVQ